MKNSILLLISLSPLALLSSEKGEYEAIKQADDKTIRHQAIIKKLKENNKREIALYETKIEALMAEIEQLRTRK